MDMQDKIYSDLYNQLDTLSESEIKEYYNVVEKYHMLNLDVHKSQKAEGSDEWCEVEISKQLMREIDALSVEKYHQELLNPNFTVSMSYSLDITTGFKQKDVNWKSLYKLANSSYNYTPSTFRDGYRKADNFLGSNNCIVLDIDDGWTIAEAIAFLEDEGYTALICTTKSHQKEKNGKKRDRFRVFLPSKMEFRGTKDEFSYMMKGIMHYFNDKPDRGTTDSSRFYYGNSNGKHYYIEGVKKFDISMFPTSEPVKETRQKPIESKEGIANWFTQNTGEGNRNNMLYKAFKFYTDDDYTDTEACNAVMAINSGLPVPLSDHEVKSICRIR